MTESAYVGVNVCILRENYPEEQMWLDLGGIVWPRHPTITEEMRSNLALQKMRVKLMEIRVGAKYAHVPYNCSYMYEYEVGSTQMVLPFDEYKNPDVSESVRIRSANWPGFYRDSETGDLLTITLKSSIRGSLLDSSRGRIVQGDSTSRTFVFEHLSDFMQAMLLYSDDIMEDRK